MQSSSNKPSAAKQSISGHPIFPILVASWFALLLGLGSLILPIALFETLFSVTGIAEIIPAAAAPLGVTARILIGGAAAIAGALAGLLIARRIAVKQRNADMIVAAAELAVAGRSTRPIFAHEELDGDSLDAPTKQEIYGDPESHGEDRVGDVDNLDERLGQRKSVRFPEQVAPPALSENSQPDACEGEMISDVADKVNQPLKQSAVEDQDYETHAPVDPASVTYNPFDGRKMHVDPKRTETLTLRPLDELSMVELVERFALALQINSVEPDLSGDVPDKNSANSDPHAEADNYDPSEQPVRSAEIARPFDGPAKRPSNSADNPEKALRDALAKLERMSGAA